jgi:hypothetical protein
MNGAYRSSAALFPRVDHVHLRCPKGRDVARGYGEAMREGDGGVPAAVVRRASSA